MSNDATPRPYSTILSACAALARMTNGDEVETLPRDAVIEQMLVIRRANDEARTQLAASQARVKVLEGVVHDAVSYWDGDPTGHVDPDIIDRCRAALAAKEKP